MSKYSSKPVTISRPQTEVYTRLSDLSSLQGSLDNLPEDKRQQLDEVSFDRDSITITTPQVGQIKFEIIERDEPSRIVFGTPSSPLPLTLAVDLKPDGDNKTVVEVVIDVEIPMMLRPLVGGKLQEAANQFGTMLSNLCN